ncbi:MAG: choice-of-anchor J domain-containing protein [Lepagella sp.]
MYVPVGTLEAYKAAPNYSNFSSIVENGSEVIDVPAPVISMDNNNMVSMSCSDDRASIYYTFGTVSPTKENGTLYTAPFLLTEKSVVRARAYIDEFRSGESYANLEPKSSFQLPDSLLVFLNGHQAWGASHNMAWHKYPIADDGSSSQVGETLGEAACWAEPSGDLLYMLSYNTFAETPVNHLTTYDFGSMEFVSQENLPAEFVANDVAVDPLTGRIYGVFSNKTGPHTFGYINLENKTRTKIADYDLMYNSATVDRVMAFCFSPEGVPYGLTFGGRLVKFDRETGEYTIIGETGWNINYVSCARWDEATGLILYSFTDQSGLSYFYTIDPETAERTELESLPGSVTAFFTPLDYVKPMAPAAPTDVTLSFNAGQRTGVFSFKAPTTAQNGDEISGELTYRIVRKGKTVADGTVRAGAVADVNITATMDGMMTYSVVLSNNYGESLRGKASAFAGKDTPATPVVTATRVENGIKLDWDPVTIGANNGYIDADKIRYTITRYPDKEMVASLISDNTFTDVIATPEEGNVLQYYYTVVASYSDYMSAAGKSNKIVLGYFTPAWEEGFKTEDSLDNFTIINNSGYVFSDGETTSGWCWNNYWRCAGAYYHPYSDLDDWLITPPMMMEKGKTYRITFKAGSYPSSKNNFLELRNGTDNTVEAMTNVLMEKTNIQSQNQSGDWMNYYELDYTAPEDGIQYFGFHCLSAANQLWLYLDDVKILEGVIKGAPKTVDNLTIVADNEGRTNAEISFKLPTTTVDEQNISGLLKAEICRSGEVVYTLDDQQPGATVNYTDEVGAHGNCDYQVRAYAGSIPGMPTVSTVFVGNSYPKVCPSIEAKENSNNYGEVIISWTAPDEDERGRKILPENLSYTIEYAWANGETGVLASDVKGNSYTYVAKQPTDPEMFVTYQIWASTPYGKSNVSRRTAEQTPVGSSYKAPWVEGFSTNPPACPLGISLINGTTGTGWNVYNDTGEICAQDDDNCFAGFYGAYADNAGSLYTGKIDLSDLSKPELRCWVYKMGPEDTNTLEVSVGGFGNWDVVDFVSMDQLQEGWNEMVIPLEDYEGQTIQAKWVATVKVYAYVLIDNLSIDNAPSSGVADLNTDVVPVETRFFTIDGVEVKAPVAGTCCIMITKYNDGSSRRCKLMTR